MSVRLVVSEQTAHHLKNLSSDEADDDSKLRMLLMAEYKRRLSRYSLTDRRLQEKYGVTFEEFERRNMVQDLGFEWDVESDAIEWDLAIDGIKTLSRRLTELAGPSLYEH
jgi:hypothetical protein